MKGNDKTSKQEQTSLSYRSKTFIQEQYEGLMQILLRTRLRRLFKESDERKAVRRNDLRTLKKNVFERKWLLSAVILPNSDHTLFEEAITLNKQEAFEILLNQGSNVNRKDKYGTTPLMKAAALNRASMVRMLLKNGSDSTLSDSEGRTAFSFAQLYDSEDVIPILEKPDPSDVLKSKD
mmetsp:Transcript_10227/g.11122  ORF Transcript_10227/g.11122 Transcript_10227/m.11122 type:complete len:179 (+) Transcript_10227:27-563(+)